MLDLAADPPQSGPDDLVRIDRFRRLIGLLDLEVNSTN
jgi:hypothetical protein